jgi:hypothetical protein
MCNCSPKIKRKSGQKLFEVIRGENFQKLMKGLEPQTQEALQFSRRTNKRKTRPTIAEHNYSKHFQRAERKSLLT